MSLGETNDVYIKRHTEVNLGDNKLDKLLSKEEFYAAAPPASKFEDDGMSVKITYRWRNVPVYLPEEAKKHNLYNDWMNEKKKIEDYLNNILQKIYETEKKETDFKKVLRIFLGTKQVFKLLKDEINDLKNYNFEKAAPDDLKDKVNRINEIRKKVANKITEIAEEKHKEEIKDEIEDIEKRIKEKNDKKADLKKELDDHEATLGVDIACINGEIEGKKETIEKLKKDVTDVKEDGSKKQEDEINGKTTTDAEKDPDAMISDLRSNINKIENDIKILNSEIQRKNKDFAMIKIRNQNDTNNIEREIKQSQNKIEQLRKKINNVTVTQNKESSLNVFNKNQSQNEIKGELTVPKLHSLPKVGTLYQIGGNNQKCYLAISDWDDFDSGKREAKRLYEAKLCVERS